MNSFPYAGVIRIRFQGTLSARRTTTDTPNGSGARYWMDGVKASQRIRENMCFVLKPGASRPKVDLTVAMNRTFS